MLSAHIKAIAISKLFHLKDKAICIMASEGEAAIDHARDHSDSISTRAMVNIFQQREQHHTMLEASILGVPTHLWKSLSWSFGDLSDGT